MRGGRTSRAGTETSLPASPDSIITIMSELYHKHRAFGGIALEFRLSPRRFAELRQWVRSMEIIYELRSCPDEGIFVLDIPVRIDERLPPTALGIRSAR